MEQTRLASLLSAIWERRDSVAVLVTGGGGAAAGADEDPFAGRLIRQPAAPERSADAAAFLDHWQPDACLFLGAGPGPALAVACLERKIPTVLADAHFTGRSLPFWRQWLLRASLPLYDKVLVRDARSMAILKQVGQRAIEPELAGQMEVLPEVPRCNEGDREELAALLRARPVWLAAGCPEAEEDLVIAAQLHAMNYAHRLLLIIMPASAARVPMLAERIAKEHDLVVACRALDEEPLPDVQVYVTDGPTEEGLWYRLAPVTYLGGSLTEGGIRAPADAATLGSAIIHGPNVDPYAGMIARLDEAEAARPVANDIELRGAITEFIAPDKAAQLAGNAWIVTSGGAEAVEKTAAAALRALDRRGAPGGGAAPAGGQGQ